MAAGNDGTITLYTDVDTGGVQRGVSNIKSQLGGLEKTVRRVGAAIAAAFAVSKIIGFVRSCIQLGSDLTEVQNVVDVTFGSMAQSVNAFASTAAEKFGLSELSAKQYASTLGAMLKSMGYTEQQAAAMSEQLTGLAGDMASFYNLNTDAAFEKIRSGISGETEPLKQLGINLSEANLEQFRLAQGMDTAYSKMTQQQQALVRYKYLLSVTSDAQGDFARTSNSWANQTRVLSLQFQSLKANIGQGLINVFTPVLRVINAVLSGLNKVASAFKAFTALITGVKQDTATSSGASPVTGVADAYSDASDAADNYAGATDRAAKAVKNAQKQQQSYLSGLDEVRQYQKNAIPTSDVSGGGGKTGTAAPAVVDYGSIAKGNTLLDQADAKIQKFAKDFKNAIEPTIEALQRLWGQGLKRLGEFSWTALRDFYNGFLVPVGRWVMGEGIPRFIDALNNGLMKVNFERINKALSGLWDALAPFAINVGEGLLWFWENVLVPLGTWTANEVVPRFLDTVAAVLKVVNAVIEALKPLWQWFWDNVLLPIAKWTGGIFLTVWDGIIKALTNFAKWCQEHKKTIETIAIVIASFFAAWKIVSLIEKIAAFVSAAVEFVSTLSGIISALGGLKAALGLAVGAFNPYILIIGAAIAIAILLWKNWDTISAGLKKIWEWISNLAKTIWGGIVNTMKSLWENMKRNASEAFTAVGNVIGKAWNGVKSMTSTIWNGIKSGLSTAWSGIRGLASASFDGIGKLISSAWNGVKTVTGTIWGGITGLVSKAMQNMMSAVSKTGGKMADGLASAFKAAQRMIKAPINGIIKIVNILLNALTNGINFVIGMLNHLSIRIPNWVPKIGGQKFGFNLSKINTPSIPYLATGAVIPPNAPFMAVLGDQKSGTNIETPESLLRKIVREESGSGQGGSYRFTAQINRRTLFDEMISEAKLRQITSGRNPFEFA